MPATASLAVQRAMFAALSGSSAVTALVGTRVYDWAPPAAVFPYLTIGEAIETRWDMLDHEGRNLRCTLHVWSQAHGFTEAENIAEAVIGVLNRQPLTVAGFSVWKCWLLTSTAMRDPDGISRHIAIEVDVGVQAQ